MPKLPAYQKCYNKLKANIDNDVYPIGSFLPTEDELGKMFSVSRTTIRHAIDLLVRDRRIKVRQGAGTQVIDPRERELPSYSKFHNVIDIRTEFPEKAAFKFRGAWIDRIPADAKVAHALEIEEETEVFRLQRVVCADEQPVVILTNYVRVDFFPDLDTYREQLVDLYYFIQKHYGIKFETGEERINISSADFLDAQILDIAPGQFEGSRQEIEIQFPVLIDEGGGLDGVDKIAELIDLQHGPLSPLCPSPLFLSFPLVRKFQALFHLYYL